MTPVPAIEVEHLSHRYNSRTALDDVSFSVSRGEVFGLLGPNGGGKTTLFRILATLMVPTQGRACICGHDVRQGPLAIRRRLGVVFQSPSLDRKLSVEENLRHQGHLYGLHGRSLNERIRERLSQFSLGGRRGDGVEALSGGLRRRVELAKGLLHQPDVLLLDEPAAGLDAGARRDLRLYLSRLRETAGVTIFLTTHLFDEAESCDRLAILDRGRLVALDSPDSLKKTIGGDVVMLGTADSQGLCAEIRARFGGNPFVLDNQVRIERPRAHEFVTDLVEAFPGKIEAVTVAKPTLEDVFIRKTGHRFQAGRELEPETDVALAGE